MTAINDAFINALLADASYVDDLAAGDSASDLKDKLSSRMTPTLAKLMSDNFTVVTSINTPDGATEGSGFDAVVWRGNPGTPYAGQLFVSLRGTEGTSDFLSDASLATSGNARSQLVDMVNWWLRETTPAGQTVSQIKAVKSNTQDGVWEFEVGTPSTGTGRISPADLAGGTQVNGHSLGGYLAAVFTRLFGTQAHVTQTTTFNSAGLAPGSEPAFADIQAVVGAALGRPAFPVGGDTSQLNYFAQHGLNLTTNSFWFSQVGQRIELFNEESGAQIPNHFMYKLTDSLALANAMSKLDPTMTLARANAMFEAGSNAIISELEGVLDPLRRLLQGPAVPFTPSNDASGSVGTRVTFYSNLDSLQGAAQSLIGKVRIDLSSIELRAKARNDFSAMASLITLSPIVLTGLDGALDAVLGSAWGSTYTDWQSDKNMSQVDRAAGKETYSDSWIGDRSRLLNAVVLQSQRNSTTGVALDPSVPADRSYEFRYYGGVPRPGETLPPLQTLIAESRPGVVKPSQFIAFGDVDNNRVDGTDYQLGDHLYGGAGDDVVDGYEGDDYLEGNIGNDSLNGGADNDTLLGGQGADTYTFNPGWGVDTILDSDGDGSIVVTGLGVITGAGAKKIAEGIWQTPARQTNYTLVKIDDTRKDLYISFSDRPDVIRIQNWSPEKNIGITLPDTITPPVTDQTIADTGGNDYLSAAANVSTSLLAQAGNDALNGSSADDLLEGGIGDDVLAGAAGRDTLNGGDGNDYLFGASSAASSTHWDTASSSWTVTNGSTWGIPGVNSPDPSDAGNIIDAGAGNDWVAAGGGNDIVQGGAGGDLVYAMAGNDFVDGGEGADELHGDSSNTAAGNYNTTDPAAHGADVLVGGTGNDSVYGEGGDDELYGGADDDLLMGDTSSPNVPTQYHGNDYLDGGDGNDLLIGGGKDDDLYGGAGNDTLSGDDSALVLVGEAHGEDYLDGEDGDDQLGGDGGADTLYGGAGNDKLIGDSASDTPAQQLAAQFQGADYLDGEDGNDTLYGTGGADTLFGGAGNDTLQGDDQVSRLAGSAHGADYLDGEDGDDRLTGNGGDDTLFGGVGADSLWGDSDVSTADAAVFGNDYLDGEDGSDYLEGGGGADTMIGGAGADTIWGDADETSLAAASHGNDELSGDDGNDRLVGGGGSDFIEGGADNDELRGDDITSIVAASFHGNDTLDGGTGDDTLSGDGGDDELIGGDGNDWIAGEDQQNSTAVSVLTGNDTLSGDAGADTLLGGNGDDELDGGADSDILFGGAGSDSLQGGSGNDWLSGEDESSATAVSALTGNDVLSGGDGSDTIIGGHGSDALYGGADSDLLVGGTGDDTLDGGEGSDDQRGGDGNDTLLVNARDSAEGGSGDNTYVIGDNASGATLFLSKGTFGHDQIVLGSSSADVTLFRTTDVTLGSGDAGADLYIWFGVGKGIRVQDYFQTEGSAASAPNNSLSLRFADGAVWADSDIRAHASPQGIATYQIVRYDQWWRGPVQWVQTNQSYALPGQIDDATLTGSENAWLLGNSRDNYLEGNAGNNTMSGADGMDTLHGGAGDDLLQGDFGNDLLLGWSGNDTLVGGEGDDDLRAGENVANFGDDLMLGGTGNDYLRAGDGNDTLDGGAGNDYLEGWGGSNVYLFGRGNGLDAAWWNGYATKGTLLFKEGVAPADVLINPDVNDYERVTLRIAGTEDIFGLGGAYTWDDLLGEAVTVQQVRFADGTVWGIPDILRGLQHSTAGDDRLAGSPGSDVMYGGAGNDVVIGRLGDDFIVGGDGDDRLDGDEAEWFNGVGGNDTLDGGAGADTLAGGTGNNVYLFGRGDGNDVISWTQSPDVSGRTGTLQFKEGVRPSDLMLGLAEQGSSSIYVSIAGSTDRVTIDAMTSTRGAIQQFRFADGTFWNRSQILAEAFKGTPGNDWIRGSSSADTIGGLGGNDELEGGGGNDSINAGDGDDALDGGAGNDTLMGGVGDDTMDGDWNVVDGAAGKDQLVGGAGNDSYYADNLLDVVVEAADEGTDTVHAMVNWTLGANVENLFLETYNYTTRVDSALVGVGNSLANRITGGWLADTLAGGVGNDTLMGAEGNDVYLFNRGDGQDRIDNYDWTGFTADTLRFGSSIAEADVVAYRLGDDLVVKIRATADQVVIQNHYVPAPVDPVSYDYAIDQVAFSNGVVWNQSAIQAAAARAALNHAPVVGSAVPVLHAHDGGLFTYVVPGASIADADAGDWITYDIVRADGSALPSWLRFDATSRTLSGTPTAGDLGTLNLVLMGVDGYGASAVAPVTLSVTANRAPTLVTPLPDQTVAQGVSFACVVPSTAFSDPDGDTLSYTATSADGSALPSWLAFNTSTRTFSGTPPVVGTFSISLTARDGGSAFVGDVFNIVVNVQNLSLVGTAAAETLTGGTGNDTLSGLGANDSLIGADGDDRLDGGTGSDTLRGGAGSDTYVVDNIGDQVIELTNEGVDLVQSLVTYTLGANVENLFLTGTSATSGTGNAVDNTLIGNSANNRLTGGAGNDTIDGGTGNDTMLGGAGNDTFIVNVSADVITENANEGADTVQSVVTWTLGANLENLTLTGTSTVNGTGNTLDNWLIGNGAKNSLNGGTGNDTLDGGAGVDTLIGSAGNDVYIVDVSTDVITENANEGTDTVRSAVTWTLGSNLENLTLTGTSAINGTGNTLSNSLVGNAGANVLTGAAGDDIYDGGTGNDTFTDSVTTSNDTYRWGIGSGLDTLTDAGGSLDHVDLYAGIARSQLKFVKNANDLEISVLGQADMLTIKNWYVGTANQIEEFRLSDGSKMLASEVNGLLSAMAAFVPMDSGIGSQAKTRFVDMPISNPQVPQQAWM